MNKTYAIKLVSVTNPQIKNDDGRFLTAEEFIAYTARVSNPANQLNNETAPKLIKYLLEHQHYSPFEMADFGVEIQTSRAIAAQILRHWTASFQEFSQRYAQAAECFIYPARRQDSKNRQNSVDDLDEETKLWFEQAQYDVWHLAFARYKEAIDRGVAKEQARFMLPLNTKTTIYMKMNIRDWIFYLKLRSANGTQKEHMDIAKAIISEVMIPNFPVISEVFGWKESVSK